MMFQAKIPTAKDLEEVAKLNRRRQYEEARKKRIFDAKKRMFGIDYNYLQRQIAEKNVQKSKELELQQHYNAQIQNQEQALRSMEYNLEQQRRLADLELNRYRKFYQRKEQTREYDLNDPECLKKTTPIRIADNDLSLGISSAQVFAGEDLGAKERRQRQFEQQRAWLEQQILERKQAETSKQQAEEKWREKVHEDEQRLIDMEISEKRVRNQMLNSIQEYNQKMAEQKRLERERIQREKMEDDMAEIYNMLTSDMLAENPASGVSCKNPRKRIAYMYRGMTAEEKNLFLRQQAEQKESIANKKEQTKLMDKQWEAHLLQIDHDLKLKELELAGREKNTLAQLYEYKSVG